MRSSPGAGSAIRIRIRSANFRFATARRIGGAAKLPRAVCRRARMTSTVARLASRKALPAGVAS